jgi:hypothetical protein
MDTELRSQDRRASWALAGSGRSPTGLLELGLLLVSGAVFLTGLVVALAPAARQALAQLRVGRPATGRPLAGRATSSMAILSEGPYVLVGREWWRQLHFGPEVVEALASAYSHRGGIRGYHVYEPAPDR